MTKRIWIFQEDNEFPFNKHSVITRHLKHIAHGLLTRKSTFVRLFSIINLKVSIKRFIKSKDGGKVSRTVAVVGCRPHCAESLIEEILISIHSYLVSTADEIQTVNLVELMGYIGTEDPTSSTEVALETTNERYFIFN